MSLFAAAALLLAAAPPQVAVRRIDCGRVAISNAGFLNDKGALDGQPRTVAVSCYLVRDGDRYLLWDTGLAAPGRTATGATAALPRTIPTQLAAAGIAPERIGIVALSHYHADHAGQARSFSRATLMIGAADWVQVRGTERAFNLDRALFAPWLGGGAPVDPVEGDRDVFGDGRVVMLTAPGHTPGHHALLVRADGGAVILTGDLWHLAGQRPIDGVPRINTDAASTVLSMRRIEEAAAVEQARIVLGHEPADVAAIPPLAGDR